MTDRELMQQALDALQEYVGVVVSVNDPNDWTPKVADAGEPARKAIEALRARLAQPEPEPVAWMDSDGFAWTKQGVECRTTPDTYTPLYTAPPQREWVGLTDDEATILFRLCLGKTYDHFWQAIEAKLKEKNSG